MFEFTVALRPQRPYGLSGPEPRTATSTFTHLLNSDPLLAAVASDDDMGLNVLRGRADILGSGQFFPFPVHCCFTSTETIRTIKDWEPRTATSTLSQFLSFEMANVLAKK